MDPIFVVLGILGGLGCCCAGWGFYQCHLDRCEENQIVPINQYQYQIPNDDTIITVINTEAPGYLKHYISLVLKYRDNKEVVNSYYRAFNAINSQPDEWRFHKYNLDCALFDTIYVGWNKRRIAVIAMNLD